MRLLNVLYNHTQVHKNEFINTNVWQRAILATGSGLISIFDPRRDDMINAFGEITGQSQLPKIHKLMLNDAEGAQIMREKPIINSTTVDLEQLAKLPHETFGKQYAEFLRRNKITPDSRKPVHFVQDPELAYVMRRYREIHDFTHCILDMRTNMLGEVTVKVFEAVQLGLPMCWLAGLFGMLRLGPKHTDRYLKVNLPWIIQAAVQSKPLINVYFEKHFEKPMDQLRSELKLDVLVQSS